MSIKEQLRTYTQHHPFAERLWLRLQWAKTMWNMRYSDVEYAKKLTRKHKGFCFEQPTTYNEKMWFLKLANRDPLLTTCSDKHAVRSYVEACGLGHLLKEEYATFSSGQEIDFEKLPSPCYLKCNHASGMNLIYRREEKINERHLRWKFDFLLSQNPYCLSREWNYRNIPPCVVAEELLSMPNPEEDIPEIQFFCFHGEPKFFIYNLGLADRNGNHKNPIRWALHMDGTVIEDAKKMNHPNRSLLVLPENLSEMVSYARTLSKPFPHVRVDLFNIHGKVYFNELTFYSGGGFTLSSCTDLQKECGEAICLDGYQISEDAYEKGAGRIRDANNRK